MDLGLQGSRVLITGGSSGIGLAAARLFGVEGCDLALNARNRDRLEKAAAEVANDTGAATIALPGDMSRPSDVTRVVRDAIEKLGHIDVLVTCAGSSPGGLVEDLTDADWAIALESKLMGYVRACRELLPHMRGRQSGCIILVVGNTAKKPYWNELVSGVVNAADVNFASAIAEQYGPLGIRINTVNPGPVDTPRWHGAYDEIAASRDITPERAREIILGALPLGRLSHPDEIASLIVFLASPRASYINGAHIVVDGGQRKALMDVR